jgi:hypothetical protein
MRKIRTNPEHTSTPLHGKFCCTPKRFCSSNEIYWQRLLNPGGGPANWVKKYRQNRNSLIIDIIDNLTSINGGKMKIIMIAINTMITMITMITTAPHKMKMATQRLPFSCPLGLWGAGVRTKPHQGCDA